MDLVFHIMIEILFGICIFFCVLSCLYKCFPHWFRTKEENDRFNNIEIKPSYEIQVTENPKVEPIQLYVIKETHKPCYGDGPLYETTRTSMYLAYGDGVICHAL